MIGTSLLRTFLRLLTALYSASLYAYPRAFRRRFGAELRQAFRDRARLAFEQPGQASIVRFLVASLKDWTLTVIEERSTAMLESLSRNKRRLLYASAALLVALAAPATTLRAYVISTASMEGSLHVGDRLIFSKHVGQLDHGDIIAHVSPTDPDTTWVKRVVGLPGDRIRIVNKQLFRNGLPVDEPYVIRTTPYIDSFRDNFPSAPNITLEDTAEDMLAHHVIQGEVVVPAGHVFVMGDNRDRSLDSRFVGFIKRENIKARLWFKYWPGQPAF